MKTTGDIGIQLRESVFNSELHLYLDGWDASTGHGAARYRCYLSLLNAERRTASYAWGMWNRPGVAKTHGVGRIRIETWVGVRFAAFSLTREFA